MLIIGLAHKLRDNHFAALAMHLELEYACILMFFILLESMETWERIESRSSIHSFPGLQT